MHRLLQRQLKKVFAEGVPDDPNLHKLIEIVDSGYQSLSEQLMITERSLDLSCAELTQRNNTLNLILDSLPDMSLWIDRQGVVKDIRSGNFEPPILTAEENYTQLDDLDCVQSSPELQTFLADYQNCMNRSGDLNIHSLGIDYLVRARLTNVSQNRWLLVLQDIYLRKKIEELQQQRLDQSKRSVKQLQELINSAPIGILICSSSLKVIMINDFTCQLLGREKEDIVNSEPIRYIAEEMREVFESNLNMVIDLPKGAGITRCDLMLRLPDKRVCQIEMAFSKLLFQQQHLIIMSMTDISERKQLEKKLKNLAETDPLTGAFNRRSFLTQTERAVHTCQRWRTPLTVMLIDIDFFKQVNDSFGHAAGDEVLIALVSHLQQSTRDMDILGRLGGEEFALVLPNTDKNLGYDIAERLRKDIEAMAVRHEEKVLKITVSIGMTTIPYADLSTPFDEVMKQVDGFLYCAKKNGRNRIVHNH
ncbi:diguanylate cyclase [Vibrio sp. TRT 21S02]|uniref:sensor domain-containing diguanylate cyclase n=1 Tax=Vibrio sp. TRT 21S02 TaxID=3418507 RepID=UPI003CF16EC4